MSSDERPYTGADLKADLRYASSDHDPSVSSWRAADRLTSTQLRAEVARLQAAFAASQADLTRMEQQCNQLRHELDEARKGATS